MSDEYLQEFEEQLCAELDLARVVKSAKRSFTCRNKEGKEVQAVALAKLLKSEHIVVGDWVGLRFDSQQDSFTIEQVAARRNEVFRVSPREKRKKTIASNIDAIAITVSCSRPSYKRGLVDRYLLRAVQWDIPTFIVFNKSDEKEKDSELDLLYEHDRVASIVEKSFEVSALVPSREAKELSNDLDDFKKSIRGKTLLFLGQSGVGKSKLISVVADSPVELLSKPLMKVGKGAHTTTWAELLNFDEFSVIDSPGIRSFAIDDILSNELDDLFPDLLPYFQECRFNNCEHLEHSKDCAFHRLDPNKRQDAIALDRLESYQRFKEEITKRPDWEK